MDPISQGVFGASLPQALTRRRRNGNTDPAADRSRLKTITWCGALAGMAPDLDVLIRSPVDPILFLEYHRQFSHALVFIPIGALICALVFYRFARHQLSFAQLYCVCLAGYATHGLLDACTTYGTQLFWPFSNERVAWNNISIIDPILTLPLLALAALTVLRGNPWFARAAVIWALVYLSFGVVQRERAETLGWALAESRGHAPERLSAKPGFANLFLWKVVYEANDVFHVDAVRIGISPVWFEGQQIRKLDVSRDLAWLDPGSQQALDVTRFNWFSMDYLAVMHGDSDYIIDVRFSMLPNEINPLWGIRLNRDADHSDHVSYVVSRDVAPEGQPNRVSLLTDMLFN